MTRREIMDEIKKITGTRHGVRVYGTPMNVEKMAESRAEDLRRDIEIARYCYRNRYGLETV